MTLDEQRGRHQVRELVEATPAPKHNVNMQKAIAAGRTAILRRRWFAVAGAAAAVLLVSASVVTASRNLTGASSEHRPGASPSPPPSQSPGPSKGTSPSRAPIGTLDCAQTSGTGVGTGWSQLLVADPTGRYIAGRHEDTPDTTKLSLWRDGVRSTIDFYPMGFRTNVTPKAMNSSGVMIGTGNIPEQSWVYRHGDLRTLESPTDYVGARVVGLNERGDAVGYAWRDVPEPAKPHRLFVAVIWAPQARYRPQILPSERDATAMGVTDDGTVIGALNDASRGTESLYAWSPDGGGRALPMPDGWEAATNVQLRGAWVVAEPRLPGPRPALMSLARWDLRTNELRTVNGVDLTTLQSRWDTTFALNAAGWLLAAQPGQTPIIVKPDGSAGHLPVSAHVHANHSIGAVRLSDDGLTVTIYLLRKERPDPVALVWRCQPW